MDTANRTRKRARWQRTDTGTYFNEIVIGGRKFRVSGSSPAELERKGAPLRRLAEDVRLGLRSREEAFALLTRRTRRALGVRELLEAYGAGQSPQLRTKLRSMWLHQYGPHFTGRDVSECHAIHMTAWVRAMEDRGYKGNTIRIAYELLHSAVVMHVEAGALDAIPWGTWRPKVQKDARAYEKAVSVRELLALLRAAHERDLRVLATGGHLADLVRRVVVLVLLGLRKGEGAGLAWDDFDLDRPIVTVRVVRQVHEGWQEEKPAARRPWKLPKGGRVRPPSLVHPAAVYALLWQRDELKARGWYRDDGPVFPGPGGAWRKAPDIMHAHVSHEIAEAAGLPRAQDWTVHSFRHSGAALEAQGGASIEEIARRTGWASLGVAERYARTTGRGLVPSRIGRAHELSGGEVDADARELLALLEKLRALHGTEAKVGRVLAEARAGRAREGLAIRRSKEAHDRKLRRLSWADLGRRAVADGREVPPSYAQEAYRRAKAAGSAAYMAALRDTENVTEAQKARRDTYAAARRVWRRALARARDVGEPMTPAAMVSLAEALGRECAELAIGEAGREERFEGWEPEGGDWDALCDAMGVRRRSEVDQRARRAFEHAYRERCAAETTIRDAADLVEGEDA